MAIAQPAAREKVRVAHALKDPPRTAEKLARGEISYSKVRALTRVATPADEEKFLGFARYGTASNMERLVRGIRQAEQAEDAGFVQRVHEQRGPPERFAAERADALAVMAESFLAHEVKSGDRYQAVIHVSAETSEMSIEDGPVLSEETGKRLLCDTAVCRHHHRRLHEGGRRLERQEDGTFEFFNEFGEHIPEAFEMQRAELEALMAQRPDVSAETYECGVRDQHWDAELAVWAFVNNSERRASRLELRRPSLSLSP